MGHTERAHAILSASGSSRWLNCTPSTRLEEKFKDSSSEYADEGTLAHELAELRLRKSLKLISTTQFNRGMKEIQKSNYYSAEMETEVEKYTSFVLGLRGPDATVLIEEEIDLTDYIPEGKGTNDSIIIQDQIMWVNDLKYGKGVKVFSEENSQLMLYGLGAMDKYSLAYDIKIVRLTIVQPRLDHIDSWDITVEELSQWGEKTVKPKAALAWNGEGETNPGTWCRWCKAKARCKALADQSMEIAKHDFSNPELLSDEELIEIHSKIPGIQDWMNAVLTYMFDQALDGKNWPGLKLVEGRSNRIFTDQDSVFKILSDLVKEDPTMTLADIEERKMKSLGKIEKLLGKKAFNEILGSYVEKPQGKPTLVDESDKRPAMGNEQAKIDFK